MGQELIVDLPADLTFTHIRLWFFFIETPPQKKAPIVLIFPKSYLLSVTGKHPNS